MKGIKRLLITVPLIFLVIGCITMAMIIWLSRGDELVGLPFPFEIWIVNMIEWTGK